MSRITSANFRIATPADSFLPTYDNTKLVALNTCPTWGILRYQMHKTFSSNHRAMALEAGSAMHEVFAWVRLCQLRFQLEHANYDKRLVEDYIHENGDRLFRTEDNINRYSDIIRDASAYQQWDNSDPNTFARVGSLAVLETGMFYDDPNDRRRTLANLQEAALVYCDRWRWDHTVWLRHREIKDNPDNGIERPFDIVTDLTFDDRDSMQFRLTGRIDGIHVVNGRVLLHENKTASRLNDAWSMSFHLNSQPTHYMVAASTLIEKDVRHAEILGLQIPQPRSSDVIGYVCESVSRKSYHFERWLNWLVHTIDIEQEYLNNPIQAPKYTHSCNRYFRPCSFIPFCDADNDEQHKIIRDEMIVEEWSPLELKAQD